MKKLNVLILALTIFFIGGLSAQQTMTKGQSKEATKAASSMEDVSGLEDVMKSGTTKEDIKTRAEDETRTLDKMVGGLSADQRAQVKDLNVEIYNEALEFKQSNKEAAPAVKRDKARELKQKRKDGYMSILTDEQMAKITGGTSSSMNNTDKAVQMAEKQTEELHKIVNLTPDQKAEIVALNKSLYAKGKASKAEGTAGEKGAMKKELQKERLEGYKNILTEEQIAKFIEYRKSN